MPFDAPAIADVVESIIRSALAPLIQRLKALETTTTADVVRVEGYTSFLQRDLAAATERLATLEAKSAPQGPPGPPGPAGADGVGFSDYSVEYDGERAITHKWTVGGETKELRITTPIAIYRGVYVDGRIYERGDFVTVNGSLYHCDSDTTARPGEGAKEWTLAVKRGKDDRKGATWPR